MTQGRARRRCLPVARPGRSGTVTAREQDTCRRSGRACRDRQKPYEPRKTVGLSRRCSAGSLLWQDGCHLLDPTLSCHP